MTIVSVKFIFRVELYHLYRHGHSHHNRKICTCLSEISFFLPSNCYQHVCEHYKSAHVDS